MSDCPHGLDDRWCAACLHGPAPKVEAPRVVRRFVAQYLGRCTECGEDVLVGDAIAKLSTDRYVHSPDCEPEGESR